MSLGDTGDSIVPNLFPLAPGRRPGSEVGEVVAPQVEGADGLGHRGVVNVPVEVHVKAVSANVCASGTRFNAGKVHPAQRKFGERPH